MAFETARDDAEVRGVILTGAGDKAFIACADISELAHLGAFEASGGPRLHRGSRQTGDRRGQRLRAWRRMRDRDGLHHQGRVRYREIWPA
jgi:enoyl-CoA hydratase/carnithine racemase